MVSGDSACGDPANAGPAVAEAAPAAPGTPRVLQTIAELRAGDHLCCLYDDDDEHRAVLTPFLRQGLEHGEKVVYVADAAATERAVRYLRDDGLAVEAMRRRGQFATVARDTTALRDGLFDPFAMFTMAKDEVERAAAEGYEVVRVAEDRTWAVPGLPSSVRLAEFERLLDGFLGGARALALCLYDRRRFVPATLLDALPSHPWAIIGGEVCENVRYVPPDDVPSAERPAAELVRWLRSLVERKHAAEALTQERFLMHTLMDQVPDNIYFKDRESRFIRISSALARIFGLSDPAEAIGKSDFDFFSEEHARQAYEDEQAIIRRGEAITKEERETWTDRPDTWVSTTKVPLRDAAGNPVGTFGISRDITAHKRAESESERLIGELKTALSKLERLSALLPVCSSCGKVRDDDAYMGRLQALIEEHAAADGADGLCPGCAAARSGPC
jgi:PAS domain S-box-containing protein